MSYLKVSNFTKYINKNKILDNISFELEKGKVLVLLGKSGAGKTTLLRNINFLDFPNQGTLELDGEMLYNYNDQELSSKELQKRHKLIGLVFQNFNLFPHYSVIENVTLAVNLENKQKVKQFKKEYNGLNKKQAVKDYENKLKEETNNEAISILKSLGLEGKVDSYPFQLSGGEQQRVAIARALILNPKVLCFDEPTSALDPEMIEEVLTLIMEVSKKNITMIVVTHELKFAYDFATRVIFMDKGKIVEDGEKEQIFNNPKTERLQKFLSNIK